MAYTTSNSIEEKKIVVEKILLRRGNTEQQLSYVGAVGEVTLDTDLQTLRVHDGVNPGGILIPSELTIEQMVTDYIETNVSDIITNVATNIATVVATEVASNILPNLESISSNVSPSLDSEFDLGTPDRKWRSLYVSSNTIHIGDSSLGVSSGKLTVTDPTVLEANVATEQYVHDLFSILNNDLSSNIHALDVRVFALEDTVATEQYVNDLIANLNNDLSGNISSLELRTSSLEDFAANVKPTTETTHLILTNADIPENSGNIGLTFPDGTVQTTAYSPIISKTPEGAYIENKVGYIEINLLDVIEHDYTANVVGHVENSNSVTVTYDPDILMYANNQSAVSISVDSGVTWESAFINGIADDTTTITLTRSDWREVWNMTDGQIISVRTFENGDPVSWFEIDPALKGGVITYQTGIGVENITGTIQLVSSDGVIKGIHLESLSNESLKRYNIWEIPDNYNNAICVIDTQKQAAQLKFHWTATLFY